MAGTVLGGSGDNGGESDTVPKGFRRPKGMTWDQISGGNGTGGMAPVS